MGAVSLPAGSIARLAILIVSSGSADPRQIDSRAFAVPLGTPGCRVGDFPVGPRAAARRAAAPRPTPLGTFPLAYKAKNLGLLVGMPVPGTGTFVWWENQIDPTLRFGIPMGCWRTLDGKCGENNQTDPDIRVPNEPHIMASGHDQQLEAAVKELMKRRVGSSMAPR